jgi:nuclear RNA export factor
MDRRVSLLHMGSANIITALNALPVVKHLYDDMRIDAYVLQDVVPGAQILCINFHGHFDEVQNNVKRSYDRSMLLVPAPANSSAAIQGWPAVVSLQNSIIKAYYYDIK